MGGVRGQAAPAGAIRNPASNQRGAFYSGRGSPGERGPLIIRLSKGGATTRAVAAKGHRRMRGRSAGTYAESIARPASIGPQAVRLR
jgi:hypothetical protein